MFQDSQTVKRVWKTIIFVERSKMTLWALRSYLLMTEPRNLHRRKVNKHQHSQLVKVRVKVLKLQAIKELVKAND